MIKRYECKKCNKYTVGFISVRKIQELMKEMHDVTISYQEVQDILVDDYTHYTPNIKEYSGYYAFDALWIKNR